MGIFHSYVKLPEGTILADLGEVHSASVGQKSLQVPVLVSIFGSRFRGKGFLAADESAGPWLRAGHAEAAKIPDTGPFCAFLLRVGSERT